MGATRLASGKKPCSYTKYKGSQTALITRLAVSLCLDFPDAGRVAPISACVSSSTKTQTLNATTKRNHKTLPLMGATRLASGKKPCSYTKYKGSQTALITRLPVSLCLDFRRGTRRPH